MKIINKAITLLILVLASCNSFTSPAAVSPTDAMQTGVSESATAIFQTQAAIPTVTSTPVLLPSPSVLPPTETPTPLIPSIPISGTPTVIAMENGLTWSECIVPFFDHPHETADFEFATSCLNMDWPGWDDYAIELNGQPLREERVDGDGEHGDNLRLIIGKDIYETRYTNIDGGNNYELLKNEVAIAETTACPYCAIGDPNLKLWNIGGKSVWEIFTDPPTIFVDGISRNERYQWDGSYFPYDIKNKLIYIASKNGKYSVVYDEKVIGHEFDQIYMTYCCASTSVLYGHGQYWFWGRIEGTYYVVAIH